MYSMYVMCCLYEDVCVSVSSPLDKRSKGFIEHLIDSALGHNRYKHIHSSSPSCPCTDEQCSEKNRSQAGCAKLPAEITEQRKL